MVSNWLFVRILSSALEKLGFDQPKFYLISIKKPDSLRFQYHIKSKEMLFVSDRALVPDGSTSGLPPTAIRFGPNNPFLVASGRLQVSLGSLAQPRMLRRRAVLCWPIAPKLIFGLKCNS